MPTKRTSDRPVLPPCWIYSVEDLAIEYGVTPGRIRYHLQTGLIYPTALVPRWKVSDLAPPGPAPFICVPLSDYRNMEWVHAADSSRAMLSGNVAAFAIDRDSFDNFRLELVDPIIISSDDLVVTLEQKEALEAVQEMAPRKRATANPVERRGLLAIIAALLARTPDLRKLGPYKVGKDLQRELELMGYAIGDDAIALKVIEARSLLEASVLRMGGEPPDAKQARRVEIAE